MTWLSELQENIEKRKKNLDRINYATMIKYVKGMHIGKVGTYEESVRKETGTGEGERERKRVFVED